MDVKILTRARFGNASPLPESDLQNEASLDFRAVNFCCYDVFKLVIYKYILCCSRKCRGSKIMTKSQCLIFP